MGKEADLQRAVLDLRLPRVKLYRNNVGAYRDRRGHYVRYGLCPGSSDLIGWRTVLVTPAMVGRRLAVFTALELKAPGEGPSESQADFLDAVRLAGGVGLTCDSVTGVLRGVVDNL